MELLEITELTDKDLQWLQKAALARFDGPLTLEQVVLAAYYGKCHIWRFNEGVIVTRPKDDLLWVELLAGRGFLRQVEEISKVLSQFAKDSGLKAIGAVVWNKQLQSAYERLGAKEVYREYRYEVE